MFFRTQLKWRRDRDQLIKVVKNVCERFGSSEEMVRGGEEVVRGSEEMPRSSEKFRGGSEKFREVGLHHDMRGRCAPGMAANHGKIGLNRGTWGRYAPSMAAKWSHLLLVL